MIRHSRSSLPMEVGTDRHPSAPAGNAEHGKANALGFRTAGFRPLGARVRRSPARLVAVAALALLVGATGIALPASALDKGDPGAAIVAGAHGNGYALIGTGGKRFAYGSSTPGGGLP